MASLSYPKSVRLHHRKAFQALLDKGSTHYNAVFKVFWLTRECGSEVLGVSAEMSSRNSTPGLDESFVSDVSSSNYAQTVDESRFAVSVPKKSFKRAVKRNLLKRRIREAIRLNRASLPVGFCADFLFFYRVSEVLDYAAIEKAVVEAFTAVPAKAAAKAASAAGTAEANTPDGTAEANAPDTSAEDSLVDANTGENSSTSAENAQPGNSYNTSGDE